MKRIVAVSIIVALAIPWQSAAREAQDIPPEARPYTDALDAINYWASPDNMPAYVATTIWAIQVYGLPIDTEGLEWERTWHQLIAWENGEIGAAIEAAQRGDTPDRAGQCEKTQSAKRTYAASAAILATTSIAWRSVSIFLAGNPAMWLIALNMNIASGVAGMLSAQLGAMAASIPDC